MKLAMTGERLSAQRAKELGIVQEIYQPEELHLKQIELAKKISKFSLYSLSLLKDTVRFSFENNGEAARIFERGLFNSSQSLRSKKEGVGAFFEKRKPDFREK